MEKFCMGLNAQFGPALVDQISMLKQAGFHGFFVKWERGMDIAPLYERAVQEGMIFQSIHGPFLKADQLWQETDQTQDVLDEMIECLHVCHRFQVPVMVCHAYIGFGREYCPNAYGIKNFEKLIQAAQRLRVRIAFENTEGEEYLACLMDRFSDSEWVGFCWDTGHEMCYNRGRDMMAAYGNRLMATHINDNLGISDPDGKIFWTDDLHLLPFDGIGNWKEIAGKLRKYHFSGPLTFELLKKSKPGRNENDVYDRMSAEAYFAAAYERAVRLYELIHNAE